jgi:hypothetical protein
VCVKDEAVFAAACPVVQFAEPTNIEVNEPGSSYRCHSLGGYGGYGPVGRSLPAGRRGVHLAWQRVVFRQPVLGSFSSPVAIVTN